MSAKLLLCHECGAELDVPGSLLVLFLDERGWLQFCGWRCAIAFGRASIGETPANKNHDLKAENQRLRQREAALNRALREELANRQPARADAYRRGYPWD